jgi:hypothetical protein
VNHVTAIFRDIGRHLARAIGEDFDSRNLTTLLKDMKHHVETKK